MEEENTETIIIDDEIESYSKSEILHLLEVGSAKLIEMINSKYSDDFYSIQVLENKLKNYVYCKHCNSLILQTDRNTTVLTNHLKANHTTAFKKYNKDESNDKTNNTTLISTFFKRKVNSKEIEKAKELASAMVCKGWIPFNFLNCKEFYEYSKFLLSLNNVDEYDYDKIIPNKEKIRRYFFDDFYQKIKQSIIEKTKRISKVSVTIDLWKNKNTNRNYIGITTHNLELNTGKINKTELGLIVLKGKCSHDIIKKNTFEKLMEFFNEQTKFIFTTDNGSNLIKAFGNDRYSHVTCAAHNLNIILKTAIKQSSYSINVVDCNEDDDENLFEILDEEGEENNENHSELENMDNENIENTETEESILEIEEEVKKNHVWYSDITNFSSLNDVIDLCRTIVKYMKKSGIANDLGLHSDVITRFNSVYLMMNSINSKIDLVLNRLSNKNKNLGQALNNCRNLLNSLCIFLAKFDHIIKRLSVEDKPNLYLVLIYYYLVKNEISIPTEQDYDSIKILKNKIQSLMSYKYKINPLHYVSTFLNPETKSFYFVNNNDELKQIHEELFQFFKYLENELSESKKKLISKTESLNYVPKQNSIDCFLNRNNMISNNSNYFEKVKPLQKNTSLEDKYLNNLKSRVAKFFVRDVSFCQ